MATDGSPHALNPAQARNLATTTKTTPQMVEITPRWLVQLLQWVPVEAGIYRVNQVKAEPPVDMICSVREEKELPETYVPYEENPREYVLSSISTIINVQTRVSDLFSSPFDQVREQLRLAIESVKERQESELINNAEYGLLKNAAASMRLKTRKGPPTPDDFDELSTTTAAISMP
jgi:hypothetical protein